MKSAKAKNKKARQKAPADGIAVAIKFDTDKEDAHKFRLKQAEELIRQAKFNGNV